MKRRYHAGHKHIVNFGVKHRQLRPPTHLLADKATVVYRSGCFIRSSSDRFYTAKQVTDAPQNPGNLGWKQGDQLITPTMGLLTDLDKWNPGIYMIGPGADGRQREFLGTAVQSNPTPLTYNGRTWYMNDKWYTEGRVMWVKMYLHIEFNSTTKDAEENDKVMFFCRGTDHDPDDANYWFAVDASKYPNSSITNLRASGNVAAAPATNIYATNTHIGEFAVQSQQNIIRGLFQDHSFYKKITSLRRGVKIKLKFPVGKLQRHLEKSIKTYKYNRDQENLGTSNSPNMYLMFGFLPLETQKTGTNGFNWTMSIKSKAKVRMYHPPVPEIERIKAGRDGATEFHPMPGEFRVSDQDPGPPTETGAPFTPPGPPP